MKERPSRADKEKTDARVNELLRVMLDGAQAWDFVDYVRQREADPGSPWFVDAEQGQEPLGYSQVRRYVQKAQKLVASSGHPNSRGELLKMHVAKRDNLYAKAVAQGDTRAALAILADQARLLDLYPARRTEHTGANGSELYPTLSMMVLAIVKAEAGDKNLVTIIPEAPSHELGNPTRIAESIDRSEEMPVELGPLREQLLQDSCIVG